MRLDVDHSLHFDSEGPFVKNSVLPRITTYDLHPRPGASRDHRLRATAVDRGYCVGARVNSWRHLLKLSEAGILTDTRIAGVPGLLATAAVPLSLLAYILNKFDVSEYEKDGRPRSIRKKGDKSSEGKNSKKHYPKAKDFIFGNE
ncbi:hypothetical protein evm_003495 [Chilo suppressalis]|nr:hypothetical protein evm_003495 [Chilo suppressalis]